MAFLTRANYVQPQPVTTAQRDAYTLVADNEGLLIYNLTELRLEVWNGSAWEAVGSSNVTIDGSQLVGEIDGGAF